jgi:hypothetical protein
MKKSLIAVLIAANLLMLVIGILTIPPNLRASAGKDSPVPGAEQTPPVAPSSEEETPPADPSPEKQMPPADPSPEEEILPAATESVSIPEPEETGVSLSTEERPDLEDFFWYTEDVQYNGVPADANTVGNIGRLTGSWKALIIYDPDNEYDSGAMEFLNISIAGTEESLSLTLDWYHIFWSNDGESFDETDMEDSVFTGKWENGGLWASGLGTIRLAQFYELNGKQYAVGTMDTPDGIPALVALVRP